MSERKRLIKEDDYEIRFRCAGGIGILREEVWTDADGKIARYNLAFLLPHVFARDNGRVLGFDNAHGQHERHYLGTVSTVSFESYSATAERFIARSPNIGGAMKTKIFHDGLEGHMARSRERNIRRSKGETLQPEKILTFADADDMLECLTAQRIRLCQAVRKKRMSISALAEELGRNRGSVTRDVNKLLQRGMLRLREEVNPGHGVVQIVEPVAERCEMRIEF